MTKARDLANSAAAFAAVSATELGYVDGVTSAIQTQIDGKQAINANVSTTELGYLDGVTSAIQTQIDAKLATATASSTYIPKTLTTTTGDIIYASGANTPARLGIGSSAQVLTVSSGVPAWTTVSSYTALPAFFAYRGTSNQSISAATWTKVQFNAESFDTDSCFDSTTNYRFTPTKSGYYQINANLYLDTTNDGNRNIFTFYKNGSAYATFQNNIRRGSTAGELGMGGSTLMYFNGSSDYMEVYVYSTSSSTLNYGQVDTMFSGIGIRS